jgi:hypothetical protein
VPAPQDPVILPAALAAAWGTAALSGLASPDLAGERITAGSLHRVVGVAVGSVVGVASSAVETWPMVWAHLGRVGATAADLVLPRPGDLYRAPVDHGAVVRIRRHGEVVGWLVPGVSEVVLWTWFDADGPARAHPQVSEADRSLREAVHAAAHDLAELDVARQAPQVRALLDAWTDLWGTSEWPPTIDGLRRVTLVRAARLWAAAEIALADDGGAVGLGDATRRAAVLRELARTARTAVCAAINSPSAPAAPGERHPPA